MSYMIDSLLHIVFTCNTGNSYYTLGPLYIIVFVKKIKCFVDYYARGLF